MRTSTHKRNSFTGSRRQAGVGLFPGRQVSITVLGRTDAITANSPLLPSSPAVIAEQHRVWWGIPLGSAGVSCPGWAPSASQWWGSVRGRKGLDTVQALLSDSSNIPPSALSTAWGTDAKHSSAQTTRKTLNSLPAKTSTSWVSDIFL